MKLSHYSQGRDNNFNLIRIVAALAVLMAHSYALSTGIADIVPFRSTLGMTIGTMAVDLFFITSGFLVTSSLLCRQSAIEFIWARVLRIFPALLVMLLFTVFILGVFFTSLPTITYLSSTQTYFYFAKCATLFTGIIDELPGVFDNNPYKNAVNGSLWTMPYEVRMYAILALAWFALRVIPNSRLLGLKILVVALASIAGIYIIAEHFFLSSQSQFMRLLFMFFIGASFYVLRDYIILSRGLFWLLAIALAAAASNQHAFFVVYVLSTAYLLFYLAYVPSGVVRNYNRLGDYSYGIYIYAFPVQQSIVALIPGIPVFQLMLFSAIVTILLAMLSWHFLERSALKLKEHYINHTRKWFGLTNTSNF